MGTACSPWLKASREMQEAALEHPGCMQRAAVPSCSWSALCFGSHAEEVRPLSVCIPPPPLGFVLLFFFPCAFFFLPSSPLLPRRRQESEQTCLPKDALCLPGRRRPIPAVHFLPVPRAPGMLSHTCVPDPAPTPPTSYYIPEIKYLMRFVRG